MHIYGTRGRWVKMADKVLKPIPSQSGTSSSDKILKPIPSQSGTSSSDKILKPIPSQSGTSSSDKILKPIPSQSGTSSSDKILKPITSQSGTFSARTGTFSARRMIEPLVSFSFPCNICLPLRSVDQFSHHWKYCLVLSVNSFRNNLNRHPCGPFN